MAVKRDKGPKGQGDYGFGTHSHVPLQVTRWTEQRDFIAFTGTSQRITLPEISELIELSATENCFINFGDSTVVASSTIASDGSRLFLAGVQVVPVPIDIVTDEPFTHLAVIRNTVDGTLQVEKVE